MSDLIESRMNFIIEQQAQFAADMQVLKERQAEMLQMIEAHSRQIEAQSRQIEGHSRQIEGNAGMIRQLVDVNLSLARHLEETDRRLSARMEQLAEAQTHTEYKLNALIDTVDKVVRRDAGAS